MTSPFLSGLFIGLSQLLATLIVYALGLHGSHEGLAKAQMPESLIGFILLMVLLGFAHRSARNSTLAGGKDFTFGVAAKFAALTALVGGLVTGAGQWLYLAVINPGLSTLQREQIMAKIAPDLAKLSPDDAAKMLQKVDYFVSPGARALVYCVNTLLFAVILGIAYALIFRASVRRDEAAKTVAK